MGQFDSNLPAECELFEAMCPDAVDGTLTEREQLALNHHIASCVHCSEELAAAQRGAAWLGMLKGHTPEPPASLMDRILAQTSGAAQPVPEANPVWTPEPVSNTWTRPRQPVPVEPKPGFFGALWARTADAFRIDNAHSNFQPRFAMTAAMAFFSLALSMNLMGVNLRDLHSFSLRHTSLTRTVADAGAEAERKFQNMRVVYQLESRVSDLRNDDTTTPPQEAKPKPRPQQPNPGHGSSDLVLPPAAGTSRGQAVARGEV